MTKGSTEAEKAKWRAMKRPHVRTGQLPFFVAQSVYGSTRTKRSNPKRQKRKAEQRAAYELALQRQREVGINPVYAYGAPRNGTDHKAWLTKCKAWDAAHRATDRRAA